MRGAPPFWCRNAPDAGGHAWSAPILVQKCTRCGRACMECLHSGAEMHQMLEGMRGAPPFWCRNAPDAEGRRGAPPFWCRNAPDAGGQAWSAPILVQKCTRCWRVGAERLHSGAEMHQMREGRHGVPSSGAEMHQMREGWREIPLFWCRNAPDAGGHARSASILVQKCTRYREGRHGVPSSGAEMHQFRRDGTVDLRLRTRAPQPTTPITRSGCVNRSQACAYFSLYS